MRIRKRQSRVKMSKQKIVSTKKNETMQRKSWTDVEPGNRGAEKSSVSGTSMHRKATANKRSQSKSPKSFATAITNLIDKASPLKQSALEKRGIKKKLDDEFLVPPLKKTMLMLLR